MKQRCDVMKEYLSNDKMELKPKTDYREPFIKFDFTKFGMIASEVAWDAVLSCFEENQTGQVYQKRD